MRVARSFDDDGSFISAGMWLASNAKRSPMCSSSDVGGGGELDPNSDTKEYSMASPKA